MNFGAMTRSFSLAAPEARCRAVSHRWLYSVTMCHYIFLVVSITIIILTTTSTAITATLGNVVTIQLWFHGERCCDSWDLSRSLC